MFNRKCNRWCAGVRVWNLTLVAVTLAWSGSSAHAGLSEITLNIQAQSSLGIGSFQLTLSQTNFNSANDTWWWNAPSSISLVDEGNSNLIATINSTSFSYVQDPEVNFGFTVTAGTEDTVFTITSALLNFTTINSAFGSVSAGLTLSDGDFNGATLTGLGPNDSAYLAQYNGMVPGGTTFAELMSTPLTTGINGTSVVSGAFPVEGGFVSIGGSVSSMSAQFSFLLTANDIASGSSSYQIVPSPGVLSLLGIGLIGSRRRRRRG